MPTCEASPVEAPARPPQPAIKFRPGDRVYLDTIRPSAPFVAVGGLIVLSACCAWVVDPDGDRWTADGRVYYGDEDGPEAPKTFDGFWHWRYEAFDDAGVCYDGPFILQSEATPQHMLQEKINTGNLDLWDGPEARAKRKAAYEEWVAAGCPETDFTRKIFDDDCR